MVQKKLEQLIRIEGRQRGNITNRKEGNKQIETNETAGRIRKHRMWKLYFMKTLAAAQKKSQYEINPGHRI